ncbi:protein arginine N-methyltransferase 5 [Halorhabdus tiamatea SARL4B]|uniref:Methyltransferase type 11 n=1 Tax=Halorhabdus tiamatea SARL4B TaxID=1033806 RepID=F7PIS7_9EURY|nr:class I SAM-dependent methyltransferase [Halorhabdus tiamatea]ERJ05419.1 protein arginine N-methyltransferase 5 [Halorhabdus tiamatea SARL4B]CCQ33354.1 methyltransferase type 11 [Halorhabdus tiamatea SARL4B]
MDVPETVTAALADCPVEGARCLEAGAGAGNATAGLLEAGADHVVAVTNEREHAQTVRERVGREYRDAVRVLEADLREIPLPDDAVEIVTAHALFNVVPPAALDAIAAEVTRVASPGAHLIVDDYAPLPGEAAMRDLFAVENAAAELAVGRSALTFYPARVLRGVFESYGWVHDRTKSVLDPVPWTESHVAAHADVAKEFADDAGRAGNLLAERADEVATNIGSESTGEMYSLAMELPA